MSANKAIKQKLGSEVAQILKKLDPTILNTGQLEH